MKFRSIPAVLAIAFSTFAFSSCKKQDDTGKADKGKSKTYFHWSKATTKTYLYNKTGFELKSVDTVGTDTNQVHFIRACNSMMLKGDYDPKTGKVYTKNLKRTLSNPLVTDFDRLFLHSSCLYDTASGYSSCSLRYIQIDWEPASGDSDRAPKIEQIILDGSETDSSKQELIRHKLEKLGLAKVYYGNASKSQRKNLSPNFISIQMINYETGLGKFK